MKRTHTRRYVKRRKNEKSRFFSNKDGLSHDQGSGRSFFQPKLEVGDPADFSEREADTMADHVVDHTKNTKAGASEGNAVQRQEKKMEEPAAKRIQRQADKKEEPAAKRIQRQPDKKEEPAAKLIQRQPEKKEKPAPKIIRRQKKEEEKPAAKIIQRQADEKKKPAAKLIQRQPDKKEEPVQPKLNAGHSGGFSNMPANTIQAKPKAVKSGARFETMVWETKGMGMALPDDIRAEMEGKFHSDFSQVRIHTGEKAELMTNMIDAQAFTHGYDIYFNAGKYQPNTTEGKRLLAHELTHVVQQKG